MKDKNVKFVVCDTHAHTLAGCSGMSVGAALPKIRSRSERVIHLVETLSCSSQHVRPEDLRRSSCLNVWRAVPRRAFSHIVRVITYLFVIAAFGGPPFAAICLPDTPSG